jgi:membrane protein DedA with SNARE-associated domain
MLENVTLWLVNSIGVLGYWGVLILMTIESSFFPFPSEVVIIPAGFLAAQGKMNIYLIWVCGVLGSLLGALFNYYFARLLGRPFIDKYGKYFLISKKSMTKADEFFQKHGNATTFFGRLLPGVRQYISLPAGLTKMNIWFFSLYTVLGAGIWVAILIFFGYKIGEDYSAVAKNMYYIVGFVVLMIISYIVYLRLTNGNKKVLKNEKD